MFTYKNKNHPVFSRLIHYVKLDLCTTYDIFFYLRESALTSDIREVVLKALIANNKRGHLRIFKN